MNPVCPYCRAEIGSGEGERINCPSCNTPHHADCFAENGGCTVFGCAKAPVDEPKINVSGTELAPLVLSRPQVVSGNSVLGIGLASLPAPVSVPPAPTQPPAPRAATPPPPRPDGAAVAAPPALAHTVTASPPFSLASYYPEPRPKNRVVFILLGIFLGLVGAHNFYAGYAKKGAMQMAITLMTFFYGAAISWIWAIVEVCVISEDADGVRMAT